MDHNSNKPLFKTIPTDDGNIIFPKIPVMANYFFIYKAIDGRQFTFVEKRANPYETIMQH